MQDTKIMLKVSLLLTVDLESAVGEDAVALRYLQRGAILGPRRDVVATDLTGEDGH